ncbi:DUF3168 domain-containing protein [Shimia biformata]|uniref:DUF3168 domain-containing protein n=1 Tax=Shimia biformata TaxID=1294299 RepID=UPI0019508A9C|nr:DUF3168 domain-containing protein [Shimia biformata]
MSYGVSAALQAAIYQALSADPEVTAQLGSAVFDAMPQGTVPDLFAILGAETALDRSDATGAGAEHKVEISVISTQAGFSAAKSAAVAICDALVDADLTLTRGRLVYLRFDRATARREAQASRRRIDLRFVARVEDNQDT